MGAKQISVFLQNTAGRLSEVTQTLAKSGINLRAISIADTADFGILRLIVDKTDEAVTALNKAGFTTGLTDVAAVRIDDEPGSLAKLIELFQKSEVNIEYLYASLAGICLPEASGAAESNKGKAIIIFKPKDPEKGFKLLKDNGFVMAEKF